MISTCCSWSRWWKESVWALSGRHWFSDFDLNHKINLQACLKFSTALTASCRLRFREPKLFNLESVWGTTLFPSSFLSVPINSNGHPVVEHVLLGAFSKQDIIRGAARKPRLVIGQSVYQSVESWVGPIIGQSKARHSRTFLPFVQHWSQTSSKTALLLLPYFLWVLLI